MGLVPCVRAFVRLFVCLAARPLASVSAKRPFVRSVCVFAALSVRTTAMFPAAAAQANAEPIADRRCCLQR
jgi:hypothetical protein